MKDILYSSLFYQKLLNVGSRSNLPRLQVVIYLRDSYSVLMINHSLSFNKQKYSKQNKDAFILQVSKRAFAFHSTRFWTSQSQAYLSKKKKKNSVAQQKGRLHGCRGGAVRAPFFHLPSSSSLDWPAQWLLTPVSLPVSRPPFGSIMKHKIQMCYRRKSQDEQLDGIIGGHWEISLRLPYGVKFRGKGTVFGDSKSCN